MSGGLLGYSQPPAFCPSVWSVVGMLLGVDYLGAKKICMMIPTKASESSPGGNRLASSAFLKGGIAPFRVQEKCDAYILSCEGHWQPDWSIYSCFRKQQATLVELQVIYTLIPKLSLNSTYSWQWRWTRSILVCARGKWNIIQKVGE